MPTKLTRFHCLIAGIIGLVILDTLAITVLHEDGTVMLATGTGIGGLVAYAFHAPNTPTPPAPLPIEPGKEVKHG